MAGQEEILIHGSAVAWNGHAVLILGPSGAGKSTLALSLMGMGAALVSDDQVAIRREEVALIADAPATLRGQIEARHVGLLSAEPAGPTPLMLAVDLSQAEEFRLPPNRALELAGIALPLVLASSTTHLAPAILQYLKAGRADY